MPKASHIKPSPAPAAQATAPKPLHRNFLLLIAFVEGSCVMGVELAGAKMIAPFYGTSLYIWASVLAVTLGGLTTGYYLGGWATYRYSPQKLLFGILLCGTVFIALMPLLALKLMPATSGLGLRAGSLVSSILFMFLPLVCMGMVSPTLIQMNNTELKTTGKTAGTIYAVSTVGGILMTLLMGFYLLPEWGIRKSVYLIAFIIGLMPVVYTIIYRKFRLWLGIGILLVFILGVGATKPFSDPKTPGKFIYRSEGILGQVCVYDDVERKTNEIYRFLYLNQIPQTFVCLKNISVSTWKYPHRIATLASIKPLHSKALLVGMGGGSIAMELKKLDFDLDIVEIDRRMPEIAEKYFGFEPGGVQVIVDDGRSFIKTVNKKYDLVVLDVLNGESQPCHLFTEESFGELNNILSPDGFVIVNFQGYLYEKPGLPARSIMKTFLAKGFKVQYHYEGNQEKDGDLHIIALKNDIDFRNIDTEKINLCCKGLPPFYSQMKNVNDLDLSDASVLTDNNPVLETMNAFWNEQWRMSAVRGFLQGITKLHIPLFK